MNPASRAARRAFVWACTLDVATFKPGNVSFESAGHGMQAALFVASADAAAEPLFGPSRGVGERIEAAMRATLAVAGCNTNLGIVLLAAPLAAAFERVPPGSPADELRRALREVLSRLDVADARAAYRAIALTQPGGLGRVDEQDVATAPTADLGAAMALAAHRDRIALQYGDAYGDVFDRGLGWFRTSCPTQASTLADAVAAARVGMQRVFLELLAAHPDSHIARQHGDSVAHTVMAQARPWLPRARDGELLSHDAVFRAWDDELKRRRVNPGTTADLCVATALVAAWLDPSLVEAGALRP